MIYNIPKSFEIGGQKVKVIVKKKIDTEGAVGVCLFFQNEIHIQTHLNGKLMAKSQIEQTFWHEYVHYLLSHCRQEELSSNEELVDLMGEFLYQSLGKKKWR